MFRLKGLTALVLAGSLSTFTCCAGDKNGPPTKNPAVYIFEGQIDGVYTKFDYDKDRGSLLTIIKPDSTTLYYYSPSGENLKVDKVTIDKPGRPLQAYPNSQGLEGFFEVAQQEFDSSLIRILRLKNSQAKELQTNGAQVEDFPH